MSSSRDGARRGPRSDAARNSAAVLDAAITVLGGDPGAPLERIARAAGVSRQTLHAHYPTREALLAAVVERVTAEVVDTLDGLSLTSGDAMDALQHWLVRSWELIERYPLLLHPSLVPGSGDDAEDHAVIAGRLLALVRRGQDSGEFTRQVSPDWLVAATIALGHAAGREMGAGRMPAAAAGAAFRESVTRLFRSGPQDAAGC